MSPPERAGIVVSGVLGLLGLTVALAPASWISDQHRAPLAEGLLGLAAIVLIWGLWPMIVAPISARRLRREEAALRQRKQAEEEDMEAETALRRRMDASAGRFQTPGNGARPSGAVAQSPAPDTVAPSYSRAFTEFERDGDHVYLKVTNRGIESAAFWALIDSSGPMAEIPDGSYARWVHSDDAKASIPSGEARKLKIARFSGPTYGFGTWRIPYLVGNTAQAVTPPGVPTEMNLGKIDITVTLRADPELRGGAIIRRVSLDNAGHWGIKS